MSVRIVGDRYRLEEQVGRGGTATVWRGIDLDTGVPVAVKVLDQAQSARPVALERLRREAQAVARLEHPNIIASHGLGTDGDAGFLAMELVDGPTVADLLTTGGWLPVGQAIDIAEQVCAALSAAHTAGVIHRDIKPNNLIVNHRGVVKVCDFGIARLQARDGDTALTAHSQVVGTCEYMAPEQGTGEPVDARTDLYALGCVLYAMLAARPPFLGETAMAVLHQHLHKPPAPLRSVRDDVPVELERLVGRLLAKHPDDRPATADEVRDELAAIRALPVTATPRRAAAPVTALLAKATAALSSRTGRHRMSAALPGWTAARLWLGRWWITLVSGALILVTAGTVAAVVTGRDPDRPPVAAQTEQPPADVEAPIELLEPGPTPTTVTSPSPTAPTPAAARTSSAAPPDRLGELSAAVQRLIDSGDLDARAGREILRTIAGITTAVRTGRGDKAAERLRELENRLVELRQDGKLSSAGFDTLAAII